MSEMAVALAPSAQSVDPLMSRRHVIIAVVGCFATLLLGLLDQNIVNTASWTMVKDLDPINGVAHLPWLLTTYTLADCIVLPLYGKLADVYGAKRIYLLSLGIFLAGSALCGLSQNMAELIAFRALQGVGGGGLMSVTMVVLGLLTRPGQDGGGEGSGKAGMGGIMVGLGIVLGPAVGGLVADHLGSPRSWTVRLVPPTHTGSSTRRRSPHPRSLQRSITPHSTRSSPRPMPCSRSPPASCYFRLSSRCFSRNLADSPAPIAAAAIQWPVRG